MDDAPVVAAGKEIPKCMPVPRHRHHPGMVAFGALALCMIAAVIGAVSMEVRNYSEGVRARHAQCMRVNLLRGKVAEILIRSEAGLPTEQYDEEAKKFYDEGLKGLAFVDCDNPPPPPTDLRFPHRPDRSVVPSSPAEMPEPREPPGPPKPLAATP